MNSPLTKLHFVNPARFVVSSPLPQTVGCDILAISEIFQKRSLTQVAAFGETPVRLGWVVESALVTWQVLRVCEEVVFSCLWQQQPVPFRKQAWTSTFSNFRRLSLLCYEGSQLLSSRCCWREMSPKYFWEALVNTVALLLLLFLSKLCL